MLEIREKSGPDSVFWLGSAKFSNEQAYLFRKFAAMWGTNNVDHQARICHSTTVAGVANTWGYGAMTNSYNDIHFSKSILLIGSNPTEAHPVALQHIFKAKEENNAPVIVIDPRFTRTAAHADHFLKIRPGTDVRDHLGHDVAHLRKRLGGQGVHPPARLRHGRRHERGQEVEPGRSRARHRRARRAGFRRAPRRWRTIVPAPSSGAWAVPSTPSVTTIPAPTAPSSSRSATWAFPAAAPTSSAATTTCRARPTSACCPTRCPGYYGLSAGSWKHWSRVWDLDYEWVKGQFDSGSYEQSKGKDVHVMNTKGIPVSRWIDGVLEDPANIAQKDNFKAMLFWGHAPNSQTRGVEQKKAMEKLDMMVVIDPYPTATAVMPDRKDGMYLLPASTQMETYGSVTASNRSFQWRSQGHRPAVRVAA